MPYAPQGVKGPDDDDDDDNTKMPHFISLLLVSITCIVK
jgi:hypothetical protein